MAPRGSAWLLLLPVALLLGESVATTGQGWDSRWGRSGSGLSLAASPHTLQTPPRPKVPVSSECHPVNWSRKSAPK